MGYFSFFLATRYLYNTKKNKLVHLVSITSLIAVAIGTAALVIIISVFNGFEDLVLKMQNKFDPEIKITSVEGKTFKYEDVLPILKKNDLNYSLILEEKALLRYQEKDYVVNLKGVSYSYKQRITKDSLIAKKENKILIYGDYFDSFKEKHSLSITQFAIIGKYLKSKISLLEDSVFLQPNPTPWTDNIISIYLPNRESKHLLSTSAIKESQIIPVGIFTIRPDVDDKYILVTIQFMQDLLNKPESVSAIEVYSGTEVEYTQNILENELGKSYLVQNRLQQNKFLYKMLYTEKLTVFSILFFIIIIATFNIIGLLTMSLISKKNDMKILQSLGSEEKQIQKIFFLKSFITITLGAILGLLFGLTIAYLQMNYGIVRMQGNFIIDQYPISIKYLDILIIFMVTIFIGVISSWYPSKILVKRIVSQK